MKGIRMIVVGVTITLLMLSCSTTNSKLENRKSNSNKKSLTFPNSIIVSKGIEKPKNIKEEIIFACNLSTNKKYKLASDMFLGVADKLKPRSGLRLYCLLGVAKASLYLGDILMFKEIFIVIEGEIAAARNRSERGYLYNFLGDDFEKIKEVYDIAKSDT